MTISEFRGQYDFLSNFAYARVEYEGHTFRSSEHAFQWAKCGDETELDKFSYKVSAADAKKNGRTVKLQEGWDELKYGIMHKIVEEKFSYDKKLADKLLATEGEELVEGNTWHDNYWGSCSCSKCGNKGANNLGKILMDIRSDMVFDVYQAYLAPLWYMDITIGFVGSRNCTQSQLNRLGAVAGWAASEGILGVSGGCEGADQMAGRKYVQYGAVEKFHVHMPWPQYCSKHIVPDGATWDCMEDKYNKAPGFVIPTEEKEAAIWLAGLHDAARTNRFPNLMGRNALIVMHCDLLVYAKNGDSAGTAHDVKIAQDLGIPTMNVANDEEWKMIYSFLCYKKEIKEDEEANS